MSRSMQAAQPTPLIPRAWPSMAAASARICRSSRVQGGAGAGTPPVLSLVTPVPLDVDAYALGLAREFTADARLEGQVIVTLSPKTGNGEPITLTIPVRTTVAGANRLVAAGAAEE